MMRLDQKHSWTKTAKMAFRKPEMEIQALTAHESALETEEAQRTSCFHLQADKKTTSSLCKAD